VPAALLFYSSNWQHTPHNCASLVYKGRKCALLKLFCRLRRRLNFGLDYGWNILEDNEELLSQLYKLIVV